jgi:hypothetical protein
LPRNEIVVSVFMASPGDVAPERAIARQIVEELNATWSRSLGLRLELLTWESDAWPAIAEDAQAAVNAQIPQDYDIFLGMMWGRFGTPTRRAGSGTAEEFEAALARFQSDPQSVQLMMYFKEADVPFRDIDPQQIQGVVEFRARLASIGALSWAFSDPEEFGALLRLHLSRVVQTWAGRDEERLSSDHEARNREIQDSSEVEISSPTDDDGIFDLIESSGDSLDALTQTQERMTNALSELGQRIRVRGQEMIEAAQLEGYDNLRALKRATNRSAEDMEHFVAQMRPEIAEFRRHFDEALTATGRAASLAVEALPSEDLKRGLSQLADGIDQMAEMLESNTTSSLAFRDIVASLPRLTTSFNRARRRTVAIVESSIEEFRAAAATARAASQAIRSMLNE